ncbi:MAG: hypothetical protein ABSD62_14725 [Candidatus Limnocylindrales bacterium]|jgi:hypothetical protein
MTVRKGQMAITSVIGPMSGMPAVTGRTPRPLMSIPTPSAVYWPSSAAGTVRTASQTPAPPTVPPTSTGGPCCGQ